MSNRSSVGSIKVVHQSPDPKESVIKQLEAPPPRLSQVPDFDLIVQGNKLYTLSSLLAAEQEEEQEIKQSTSHFGPFLAALGLPSPIPDSDPESLEDIFQNKKRKVCHYKPNLQDQLSELY